ncbi:MAG TPA: hypothetical protein VGL20_17810 [Candidatus Dormibacteraeota bacterium]
MTVLTLDDLLVRNQECTQRFLLGRTEIQSTLVPTPPYIILSCLDIFDRQPGILRAVEARVSPEELGRRIREPGHTAGRPVGGVDMLNIWALTSLYLWGRQFGIGLGLWGPGDRLDDIAHVLDFTRRVCRGYRDDGRFVAFEDIDGHNRCASPELIARFGEALIPLGAEGHAAFKRLNATLFLYTFLDSLECRKNTFDSGPYPSPFGDGEVLMVRDYYAMGPDGYPWSAAAEGIPYHSLTLAMSIRGTAIEMTPWATPTFSPEQYIDRVTAAALFTRDSGEWRQVPLHEAGAIADATRTAHIRLYRDVASWDLRRKIMSGALYYVTECTLSWAHEAGVEGLDRSLSPLVEECYPRLSAETVGELFGSLFAPYSPTTA